MAKLEVKRLARCEPTDDRCHVPAPVNFLPGISVRHSPSCSDHVCGMFQCDGGNWRVTNEGTLDRAEWIKGWIITQLLTRGRVECAEHPLGRRDGGWWADAFRGESTHDGFQSGSKLWALKFRHGGATNELLLTARTWALQALSPLARWGVVSRLNVEALYIAKGNAPFPGAVIHLRVSIAGPGVASTFTLEGAQQPGAEWLWREYFPPAAIRTGGRLYARVT